MFQVSSSLSAILSLFVCSFDKCQKIFTLTMTSAFDYSNYLLQTSLRAPYNP